jgi:O-antigen/teichoic acid export membrane protein
VTAEQSFRGRLAVVFAGELVNKAFAIAAFIWLAHTLDPAAYGIVEWALSMMIVGSLVADAGLSTWATAQVAAKPEGASTLVAQAGGLRLALAVPTYLALLVVAWSYGGSAGPTLAIYGVVLLFSPLFLQYLFNGLLQPRWAALGQALRAAAFALIVFLFVGPRSSPAVVALAEVLGAFLTAACSLLVASKIFNLTVRIRLNRRELRSLLAQSWPVGASEIAWGVKWYAGLILLGYLATPTDTAWHSAALRLVMSIHTVVWLYFSVLLPNLARLAVEDAGGWTPLVERSLRLTGWFGCGIALVGTLAAGTILTVIFGQAFVAAVAGLRVVIWVIPIAFVSGHFRYSLIAAQHQRREYYAALAGAATAVALALLLEPTLRSTGAAVALLGGATAYAIAAALQGRRVLSPIALLASMTLSPLCSAACLALGAILTPVAGEVVSALAALGIFAVCAVYAERESVRELLRALAGDVKLRMARTDANT